MNSTHKKIADLIFKYSEEHPEQRFGQIIFNLGINEFEKSNSDNYRLRDIYNDSDEEILDRIENNIERFNFQNKVNKNIRLANVNILSMTVNERLYVTNLLEDFENYKITNPNFARFILESLKIDNESINKIMK